MNDLNISPEQRLPSRRLVTTKEAARFLGVSPAFLERDRWAGARNGQGASIPFVAVGSRAIRYRPSDLEAFVEGRIRTSTSDA